MKLLIRWTITALALFAAAWIIPDIYVADGKGWLVYAAMAILLSLGNAFIRPILTLLTCPLVLLTLGVFTLVVNALTLWFASVIANQVFHVGFYIAGFWPAFWGSIIVSIVSVVLNVVVKDEDEHRQRRNERD